MPDGRFWGPFNPDGVRFEGDIDSLLEERKVEVVASGFRWAEGPAWWAKEKALLFSDVI